MCYAELPFKLAMESFLRRNSLLRSVLSVKNTRERNCTIQNFLYKDGHVALLLCVGETLFMAVTSTEINSNQEEDVEEFFVLLQKGYRPHLDHTLIHFFTSQCIYTGIHFIENVGQVLFLAEANGTCSFYFHDQYLTSWKPLATLSLNLSPAVSVTHCAYAPPYLCWVTSSSVSPELSKIHFATLHVEQNHTVSCNVSIVHSVPGNIISLSEGTDGLWIHHLAGVEFFCVDTSRILHYCHPATTFLLSHTHNRIYAYLHDGALSCITYRRDAIHHLFTVPLGILKSLPITAFVLQRDKLVLLINNVKVFQYLLKDIRNTDVLPPPVPMRQLYGGLFYADETIGMWNDTCILLQPLSLARHIPPPTSASQTHIRPKYSSPPLLIRNTTSTVIDLNRLPSYSALQQNLMNPCPQCNETETDFDCFLTDIFESHPLLYIENTIEVASQFRLDATDVMAPELIRGDRFYTDAIDIYALGITLWEIWTGRDPFDSVDTFKIYANVLEGSRPPLPSDAPTDYCAILSETWYSEATQRPRARDIAARLERLLLNHLHDIGDSSAIAEYVEEISVIRTGQEKRRSVLSLGKSASLSLENQYRQQINTHMIDYKIDGSPRQVSLIQHPVACQEIDLTTNNESVNEFEYMHLDRTRGSVSDFAVDNTMLGTVSVAKDV